MMPSDMFDIIFIKYGTIPSNENDLRSVVMKAGIIIEERELARPKRSQPTNPSPSGSKDKGKDAGKSKETEKLSSTQKGANSQGKDKALEKPGGKGGQVPKDKYPDQEILWPSFADAMKDARQKNLPNTGKTIVTAGDADETFTKPEHVSPRKLSAVPNSQIPQNSHPEKQPPLAPKEKQRKKKNRSSRLPRKKQKRQLHKRKHGSKKIHQTQTQIRE